jgi:hypothetical protein
MLDIVIHYSYVWNLSLITHRWKNGMTSLLRKHESHRGTEITSNATGHTLSIKSKAATQ